VRDYGIVLAAKHAYRAQRGKVEQLRADTVVNVVIVVGDLVGEVGDLRLEPGLAALDEALAELAELARVAQRAVLEYPLAAFEGQVARRARRGCARGRVRDRSLR
jgi:hypothetical protein